MLHISKYYLRPCALIIIVYGDIRALQQISDRLIPKKSEFISLLEADKRAPSLNTLNKIAAYLK
jgi:uncharacterized membrane protein